MPDATLFPLEVVIAGTPLSLQASPASRSKWVGRVREESLARREESYQLGFLDDRPLSVTIYYFCAAPMAGDVDNIIKPILDGLMTVAYPDDRVVERVVAQKFEPELSWTFTEITDQLAGALELEPPVLYLRVEDDLSWRSVK